MESECQSYRKRREKNSYEKEQAAQTWNQMEGYTQAPELKQATTKL